MKEGWTTRWKALFLWLCGYLSIIAFAVTGGYVIVKSENEERREELGVYEAGNQVLSINRSTPCGKATPR